MNKICCNISITSSPVEVSDHAFDAADVALSAACETGPYGYQSNTTVNVDEPLVHLQLTISFSISAAPGEAQKEPDNLKDSYYKRPESNGSEGQCRSPPE